MAIAGEEIVAAPRPHETNPWAEGPRFHPVRALAQALSTEGERRAHWLPVFLGAGIATYFALTVEPPWWLGLAATAATVAIAIPLRRVPIAGVTAVLLACFAAGFALIQFAAWRDGTPMLDRRLGSVALTGRVVDLDQLDRGWRVIIAPDPLPGLAPEEQPLQVRVRIPPASDAVQPGDRIRMRARLYPRRRRSCRAGGICSERSFSAASGRSATASTRRAGWLCRTRRGWGAGGNGCCGCATT